MAQQESPFGGGTTKQPAQTLTVGKSAHRAAGGDLAAVVSGLLAEGISSIRVPRPEDGSDWTWESNVTVDLPSQEGFALHVEEDARVDMTQSGYALTIDGQLETRKRAVVSGGRWFSSGSPSGWAQVQDAFRPHLYPSVVDLSSSSSATTTAISLENIDYYVEEAHIGGNIWAPICLDTKPASVTGGTGTASFGGMVVDRLHCQTTNIGIRLRGSVAYAQFRFPKVFVDADNATGLVLSTADMRGSAFYGYKAEDSNDNQTGTVGIETTADFNGGSPPEMYGNRFPGIDTVWAANDSYSDSFPVVFSDANGYEFRDPDQSTGVKVYTRSGGILQFPNNGRIVFKDGSGNSATLEMGSDGVLELTDANGTRDL